MRSSNDAPPQLHHASRRRYGVAVAVRAQQGALPVVAFLNGSAADPAQEAAFRKGLGETGYTDGQNVRVEFHLLEGQYNSVPPSWPTLCSAMWR
jgi:hypothetical protein